MLGEGTQDANPAQPGITAAMTQPRETTACNSVCSMACNGAAGLFLPRAVGGEAEQLQEEQVHYDTTQHEH